jgi:hypothetical protein
MPFVCAHVFCAQVADLPPADHPGSVKSICSGIILPPDEEENPDGTFVAVNVVVDTFFPAFCTRHDLLSLAIFQKSGQLFATGGNVVTELFLFAMFIPKKVNIKIKMITAIDNTII